MISTPKENSLTLLIFPTLEVSSLWPLAPKWSFGQTQTPGFLIHQYAFGVL